MAELSATAATAEEFRAALRALPEQVFAETRRRQEEERRTVGQTAYRLWRAKIPWRLLPTRLRAPLFARLGRRFARRFAETWAAWAPERPPERIPYFELVRAAYGDPYGCGLLFGRDLEVPAPLDLEEFGRFVDAWTARPQPPEIREARQRAALLREVAAWRRRTDRELRRQMVQDPSGILNCPLQPGGPVDPFEVGRVAWAS